MLCITAGAKRRPDESRLELLQRNVKIIHDIIDEIALQKSPAVVLIVSNPVDILTYVAHKRSGWPRGRIIGSGTVLDSARFRHLLSQVSSLRDAISLWYPDQSCSPWPTSKMVW